MATARVVTPPPPWHSPPVDANFGQIGPARLRRPRCRRLGQELPGRRRSGPGGSAWRCVPISSSIAVRPSAARFACAVSWSGPLMIELIQPLDELPSPYLDHLRSGREGLQHVCYFPEDFEAAASALGARGYEQIPRRPQRRLSLHLFRAAERRDGCDRTWPPVAGDPRRTCRPGGELRPMGRE